MHNPPPGGRWKSIHENHPKGCVLWKACKAETLDISKLNFFHARWLVSCLGLVAWNRFRNPLDPKRNVQWSCLPQKNPWVHQNHPVKSKEQAASRAAKWSTPNSIRKGQVQNSLKWVKLIFGGLQKGGSTNSRDWGRFAAWISRSGTSVRLIEVCGLALGKI